MKTGNSRLYEKGFTLVELMVALLVGSIFLIGIYTLYINTQTTYTQQERIVELQQNTRAVLDQMAREMRLAGYRRLCEPTYATPTAFEFEADTNFNGTVERIQYRLVGKNMERAWQEPAPVACAKLAAGFEVVATNVEVMNFDYYDTNNGFLDATANVNTGVALPADIRRVSVRLEAKTSDDKTVSLTSDFKLRNEGVAAAGGCTLPKKAEGLIVDDLQVCNHLKATWTPNPTVDQVVGYKVYARVSGTSNWSITAETAKNITEWLPSSLVNGTTYDVAVAARNNCGIGTLSDTKTVGPLSDAIVPDAVLKLDSDAVTNGNTVTLTWDASVTKDKYGVDQTALGHTDIDGYDVYRSTDGTNYTQLNTDLLKTVNYTDTVPVACTMYYYKVKTKDLCANVSNFSSPTVGDEKVTAFVDLPKKDKSNTRPSETVKPSDVQGFVAVAGGQQPVGSGLYRITLSWQNSNSADYKGTQVRYKKKSSACSSGDYPSNPTAETFLVNEVGSPGASETHNYDIFQNNSYYCFKAFAYDTCTNYSAGTTATSQAKTCGDVPAGAPPKILDNSLKTKAGFDVPGDNRGTATLGWTYQDWTTIGDFVGFTVYRTPAPNNFNKSFAYNADTYYAVTSAPIFFPSTFIPEFEDNDSDGKNTCVGFGPDGLSDTAVGGDDIVDVNGINGGPNLTCNSAANGNPSGTADDTQVVANGSPTNPGITTKLLPGVTYKYIVRAVDCTGNENTDINQSLTVKPGKLTRDTAVSATATGSSSKRFNMVNFAMRNTSASDITVRNAGAGQADTAVISWTNTAARLTRIVLNGTTLWQDSANPPVHPTTCGATSCSATVTFTGAATVPGGVLNQAATFTFKRTNGLLTVDMRGNTISVTITYRNDTIFTSSGSQVISTNNTTFSMTTAAGVALSGTTQDPPKSPTDPNLPATAKPSGSGGVPPGWIVGPTSNVTVTTKATPQSGTTISTVKVNYYSDSAFLSVAPDPTSVTYTEASMTSIGGNFWQYTIPALMGHRVWFFIEARDSQNQFSVDPQQTAADFIAFTYDQPGALAVNFTAAFVDPGAGDKHVVVVATVKDQSGSVVSGANVTITIGPEVFTGQTDGSGILSETSSADFGSENVTVNVQANKSPGFNPGSCTMVLPNAELSVTCP